MPDVDDAAVDEMLRAAREILPRAYVPYSGFHVGAALLIEDGSIRTAVNVENASYPLSVCAERNAVASMVASGGKKILAAAVATNAKTPTPPCGGCRQVLWEFGDTDTPVVAEGVCRLCSRGGSPAYRAGFSANAASHFGEQKKNVRPPYSRLACALSLSISIPHTGSLTMLRLLIAYPVCLAYKHNGVCCSHSIATRSR